MLFNPRQITKEIAHGHDGPHPQHASSHVIKRKFAARHLRNARQERQRRPDAKRLRVCRSLQALDAHAAGESYRTLAIHLFGAGRVAGESWRTSSLRDATIRLVRKGLDFTNGNYRRLLRQIVD
jgi:hypothetical protein